MRCQGGVVMWHMLNLASDEGDGWHSWSSVPLTVGFILRFGSCLRFVMMIAFCVHHLAAWVITV